MDNRKYLLIGCDMGDDVDFAITFSPHLSHEWVAQHFPGRAVLGAGFIATKPGSSRVRTHGGGAGLAACQADADYFNL